MTDPVDRGRNRSETFAEFARAEGFSLSTFYKLKKLGLGPDVLHVPGTRIERITPEARQAWRERMAELAKSETAQLEAERRRAQAAEAGKLAAQSPNHVSRRTAAPGRARANRREGQSQGAQEGSGSKMRRRANVSTTTC